MVVPQLLLLFFLISINKSVYCECLRQLLFLSRFSFSIMANVI